MRIPYAVATALVVAGCGSGGGPSAAPSAIPSSPARYLAFKGGVPAAGWTASEVASDAGPDMGFRPMRWCVAYGKGDPEDIDSPLILMCGYQEAGSTSTPWSPDFVRGEVGGRRAVWSRPGEDPHGWRIVAVDASATWRVLLVSNTVEVADLRRYAGTLEPATENEWRAAATE